MNGAMFKKLPVNDFKWVKETSQFNENFIKNYNDDSDERCFLKDNVQYSENFYNLHNDLLFFHERM